MDTTMNAYRHGDVVLLQVDSLPEGLEETNTRVFLHGKNNDHSIDNGMIYITRKQEELREDEFCYGYMVAENTKLFHSEHSEKGGEIKDGVYALYKQKEKTPDGVKLVQD